MTAKKIIVLGTGGNSIDILDTIRQINASVQGVRYNCVGFLDNDECRWGREIAGVEVLGPLEEAVEFPDCSFVSGIGSPVNFWRKETILARTGVPSERFETIIHPAASVSPLARVGRGTVVFQNVTITTNVRVGEQVSILPNAVLSHDDVVGDYASITGGVCVSGDVRIGRSCYLGTNSSVIGNVRIGEYSLVGMGSVVLDDVSPCSLVVGNPARFVRHTEAKNRPGL